MFLILKSKSKDAGIKKVRSMKGAQLFLGKH